MKQKLLLKVFGIKPKNTNGIKTTGVSKSIYPEVYIDGTPASVVNSRKHHFKPLKESWYNN